MRLDANALVQLVILALGIYLALGFLRTARGSGLVRGLVTSSLFGAVVLWWLSRLFALEELEHIIRGLAGYTVIVLAIVFQPELRRGIAQIGFAQLLGQLLNKSRPETVTEVAQAVRSMAKRRQGALIAFERETPLDDYVQSGVQVDSVANRLLIDTIFHPGSALHDGAIVIRKDRVTAALCLFPLTENVQISKSTGTRHRAALGLTDETDAVAVAVSEETGDISICQDGKMVRGIPPKELESLLREALASAKEDEEETEAPRRAAQRFKAAAQGFFQRDLLRKLAAVALAVGLFVVAHNEITADESVALRVRSATAETLGPPRGGQIVVQLPAPDYRLVVPSEDQSLQLVAIGTRGLIENVAGSLYGVLRVDGSTPPAGVEFPLDQIAWGRTDGERLSDVQIEFQDVGARLVVERVSRRTLELAPAQLVVATDLLDPRFVARIDQATFDPARIVVVGAEDRIEQFGSEELPFELEELVLDERDTTDVTARLGLSQGLIEAGFRFEHGDRVTVTLPIAPSLRDLSSIEREIAVVDLAPGNPVEATAWTLPPHTQVARFRIRTAGILPADDPAAPERQAIAAAVSHFVEENLVVFVDVAELRGDGGRSVPVRYVLRRDWREALEAEGIELDARADLDLELESEPEVLLVEAESAKSGAAPSRD